MGEADAGVVAFADVARIAEVEAIEADTADVLGDVEVHEVLVAGADDQAGALPQEGGQVDQGGEEDGQVADEEGGEGRHQVRVRLCTVSNHAGDRGDWCIFLLNLAFCSKVSLVVKGLLFLSVNIVNYIVFMVC